MWMWRGIWDCCNIFDDKIVLCDKIAYGCQPLITIVAMSSILDLAAASDPLLYPDFLYNSMQALQILNNVL